MDLDEVADDRKAQPESTSRATDRAPLLCKWFEDMGQHVGSYPDASVLSADPNPLLVALGSHRNVGCLGADAFAKGTCARKPSIGVVS